MFTQMSFEQEHFGHPIACRGVYQALDGSRYGYDFDGPHQVMRTAACDNELTARRQLQQRYLFGDFHGWMMWTWMNAGDRGPRDALTAQQQHVAGDVPAADTGHRRAAGLAVAP